MNKLPKPPKLRSMPVTHRRKKSAPAKAAGSHIEAHDYSPETGHLTITFPGGRSYRYEGVDKETAAGLDGADSKGRYLASNIIGKFPHTKIEP